MKIRSVYLDNITTTRPSEHTIGKMLPFLSENWGSPSAPHQMGQRVMPAVEEAYRSLYSLLGADDADTLVFTSSGTEAVNHVVRSVYYDHTRVSGKNHFLTAATDEAPSILALGRLEQLGCVAKMVAPTQDGFITAQQVADAITPRTALLSLSWANALTGVVTPIYEIADLCHERGILLHLDATHVLGKLYFELPDIGADFITFNGSNLHGPRGSGGLWIKHGVKLSPFMLGGSQQGGLRAGDVDVPALVGMGNAAQEALDARDLVCTEVARLRDRLEEGIVQAYPEATVFYRDQERVPHCTAIAFPGIVNEALLYALDREQIYASMGGGHYQQIGLVLAASGVPEGIAHSAVSFSLSRTTTEGEVDHAVEVIASTSHRLRRLSEHLIHKEV